MEKKIICLMTSRSNFNSSSKHYGTTKGFPCKIVIDKYPLGNCLQQSHLFFDLQIIFVIRISKNKVLFIGNADVLNSFQTCYFKVLRSTPCKISNISHQIVDFT